MWRGGLPPLDREAVLVFCDCFAVERGQAPSPQFKCQISASYLRAFPPTPLALSLISSQLPQGG
ncbi:hypothetical protein B0D71_21130 [Pseudomonas laurylsulfativorans]|uniref:Uncharacterized protein n=1 Tax=Pseudomonas laurylsulfativorans TaxID=1943631 RepID=A0A2S3VKG7_9PSED|nr:hypothetical protein B0D71_21130 [Pseudomonas laurylsulfativorans]